MRHVMAWRNKAVCAWTENELVEKFFPTGRPANEPKAICGRCDVRRECLEFALESPWRPGAIVAGMTPGELEPLWRQRHPHDTQGEVQALLGLR